ncbi:MAG: restriction endonuclease subunit S, partial [Bacteroidota bacterium]
MSETTDLPEGWAWTAFSEVADHRLGKMLDKRKNTGTLRPYLRNVNVRWHGFDLDDVLEMRIEDYELDKYTVRKGDLV